ncbi:MAG: hypothetical protein ABI205_09830 [Gemmatimonadaceae bacterium]
MSRFSRSALLAAVLAATPAVVHAQDQGKGFLFGAPSGSFRIDAGWALASAQSDLFSFATNELTLRRGDFSSPTLGGELAFNVRDRTQIVVTGSLSQMKKGSEFRKFVGNDMLPIAQTTTFRRVPLTVGVKQYLVAPGQSIGRLAWIPSRFAPYLSVGGGTTWYQFSQSGDFVDFNTNNIFHDEYNSKGWAPAGYAAAGLDYALGPSYALTTELKYLKSSGALSNDFSGFHSLDLSGLATTIGFTMRF